jgi:prolyl oligopeptidase
VTATKSTQHGTGDRIHYPQPERGSQADIMHGERVADPYRALEQLTAPATARWVGEQNRLTEAILSAVPGRDKIAARVAEIWQRPSAGVPFERGGRWFVKRNTGMQQQDVLWVMTAADAPGRVLLDPNAFAADGSVSLAGVSVSPDGSALAYATSEAGSDWLTWRVRDVTSGADFPETLSWSKNEDAPWLPDSSGFYYTRLPAPAGGREFTAQSAGYQVFLHRPGTGEDRDELIYTPADPARWLDISVPAGDEYLTVSPSRGLGAGTELLVAKLASARSGLRQLLPLSDARYSVVGTHDDTFFLLTDDNAGRRRIVAVDAGRPARQHWREVVPEAAETLLEAHYFGGRLVCHYLRDACSLLRVFALDGGFISDIPVPPLSTLCGSQAWHEAIEGTARSSIVHFATESFLSAPTLWRHDLSSGETSLARAPSFELPAAEYSAERLFVQSADGTAVPLFLTRRRDLPRDGNAPVLMYGYGGASVATTPSFSPAWATWLERGGMLAVASLRGGGEYGRDWHHAGRLANKQNVFDDFCACARWLASSGWSRPARIAINGASNGGILVGACVTQHPELFGAAIADVGVFDMLRFHRFTVGWLWKTEYGDPDDPEQFQWLLRYSPLHNVRPARYPAILLLTGDHDDRVVPGHTLKFGAALQAAQEAPAPVLIRVGSGAGHGHGKATGTFIAEAADRLAFLDYALGLSR